MCTDEDMKGTWFAKILVNYTGLKEEDFDRDDVIRFEKNYYITVSKLIPESRIGAVIDKSRKYHNFDIVLTQLSVFENKDCDVLHIKAEGDYLDIIHKEIQTECGVGWPHEFFNPYLNLVYLKPGTGRKYLQRLHNVKQKVTVKKIQFKLFRCDSTVSVDLPV